MKRLVKHVTSIIISCLLMISLPLIASAAETTDPYAVERTSIYNQLKAQNALHLYDHFVSVLIPTTSETASYSSFSSSFPCNAPNGGVLGYQYDYTYRNEDGYVYSVISYMLPDAAEKYLNGDAPTVGDLVYEVLGSYPSAFSFMFDYLTVISSAELIQAGWSITAADGYGKVCTAYDSISDSTPTVVVGWSDHPTIVAPRSDAYNITLKIAS